MSESELSALSRFGTSTWAYEGWKEQIYQRDYAKATFVRECLGEHCQHLYQGEPLSGAFDAGWTV